MSPYRKKGLSTWVMQEALRNERPEEGQRCRKTTYDADAKKYATAKKKQLRRLQLVLDNSRDINDNVWVGDTALTNSQKHIRIWFQNVNGIVKKNDTQEFQYNIATMADAGVNYFAFTETNLNTNKPGTNNKIVDAFNKIIPNGQFCLHNSPGYPKRSMYQPGGVAAGFDASMKMRYLKEGKDPFGRWIWQEFGQNLCITRIYTLYRVNDGSESSSGTSTAWYQQRCLYEEKGMRVNPRKQVIDDLCKEISPCIERGHNIILGGDFNESLTSREMLAKKFEEIGLYNVCENRFQTKDLPRTHSRGSKAIDHIWATRFILENTSYAGYAPFGHIWDSDHRALFMDIKASILFQNDEIK